MRLRGPGCQPCWPMFDSWDPHGGRREETPRTRLPLAASPTRNETKRFNILNDYRLKYEF